ncbi:lysM and putative peptidoglycan-binding domain-containing protein 2-like [Pollicipes pollicipes]|uniref:lysM and putative peptidoglycan-binding domain-containing protein 2-like n=1 Tax=Pollicipes pollicipes TaxID=41117 RepID=UPI001884AB48|nr:lysM and putative peptidoglycan-binding domain-containing protein 2-like [Pollicipes pollicipes]
MGSLQGDAEDEVEMRQLRLAAVRGLKFEDLADSRRDSCTDGEELDVFNAQLIPLDTLRSPGMACSFGEEQWLIASGSQRKYGTTSNLKPERLIRYDVQDNDTLQGIALKHNVTMEQLKRTNKLWTNDSLHVRRQLLVPVPLEPSSVWSDSDDSVSSPASSDCRSLVSGAAPTDSDAAPPSRTAADFLKQVDSVIASSRRNVSRLQLE